MAGLGSRAATFISLTSPQSGSFGTRLATPPMRACTRQVIWRASFPTARSMFLGRADTQIKIRGYRIEPDEIVSVLNSHPAIQASVVTDSEEPSGR